MEKVDAQVMVSVHFRNQIRGGNVKEVSRSERHQKSDVPLERHHVGEDSADQIGQRREKTHTERSPAAPATVYQHAVLAELLGNFMRCVWSLCGPLEQTHSAPMDRDHSLLCSIFRRRTVRNPGK